MPHPPSILPDAYRPPTREQIERARQMYAEKFTVSRILAACDMSLGTLYYWLDGGPQVGPPSSSLATSGKPDVAGGPDGSRTRVLPSSANALTLPTSETSDVGCGATLYPPIPRRRQVLGRRRKPLSGDRISLTARLWRAAERQAHDIEERLSRPSAATVERERDVRMLGMLVRSLRDLALFEAAGPAGEGGAHDARARNKDADDDPVPEDIDEFRRELARRIRGFIAAHQAEKEGAPDQRGVIEKS